jgi:hypothetical protein
MPVTAVLAPVFVQVALTFVLLFWRGLSRVASVGSGQTKVGNIALGQPNWPVKIQQIGNSYNNQLQVPVLFYVLVALTLIRHTADLLFVIMAWLFVASRIVHAYIHTGSNFVHYRFNAFAAGAVILLAMWLIFAARIFLGLP